MVLRLNRQLERTSIPVLLVSSLLSGCWLSAAYSWNMGAFLAPLALAPLVWGLVRSSLKQALVLTFLCATVFQGWVHIWALEYTWVGWLVLVTLKSIPSLALASVRARGPLALAILWTGVEWFNSIGPLGHTGGSLSHSLAFCPVLIQSAAWTGPWLLTFVLAYFGASLGTGHQRSLGIAIVLSAGLWLQGVWSLQHREPGVATVRLAVVQSSLDHRLKFLDPPSVGSAERLFQLTEQATQEGDLVIWSETAFPWLGLRWDANWSIRFGRLARESSTSLLLASLEKSEGGFKSCIDLVTADGRYSNRYSKQKLIPFVEYLPWERLRTWPLFSRANTIVKGRDNGVFELGSARIGVLICWESMSPEVARLRVAQGANLLVVSTNDEWFWGDDVASAHLAMAVFRAVENRRPIAQAANTGVSAVIDSRGRILGKTKMDQRTVLWGSVEPRNQRTFYNLRGDWFPLSLITVLFVSLIMEKFQ